MTQYQAKLTPGAVNVNTDGSLDTAILNGVSIQRTGYFEVAPGKTVEVADGEVYESIAETFVDYPIVESFLPLTVLDTTGDRVPKRVVMVIENTEAQVGDVVSYWKDVVINDGESFNFSFVGNTRVAARLGGRNLPVLIANNGKSYGTNDDNTALVEIGESASGPTFEIHNNSSEDMVVTTYRNESKIEHCTISAAGSHAYGYHDNNFLITATDDLESDPAIEDVDTELSALEVAKADVVVETSGETYAVSITNIIYALTVVDDQTVNEGSTLSITNIGSFSVPVFEGFTGEEPLTYTINWGDGTSNTTGSPTHDSLIARSFDGSHTYADNGVYTVTVTISDIDYDRNVSETFTVRVNNVAPTLTVTSDKSVAAGVELSITNIGSFTDPGFNNSLNVGETAERFTYSINWGDNTEVDAGSPTIDVVGSIGVNTAGSFDGRHTYTSSGSYTVTVRLIDDDGGVDQDTFTVTVS